ncbi:Ribonuclease H-like domain [Cinara cedri]|uniref:Ribonuclease H-like domain n=1 Tax=Cinara cedri TaxID=506608 RepID=A0A5E4MC66_9HEMI|nr:Ribonuclease H-like domain [Cinara cedri]
MDKEFLEPIHCHKCKKTKKFKPIKVQTTNGKETISKIKFEKITEQDKLNIAKELHKPVRSLFLKRKIKTHGIDDLWAADLVLMRNYGDKNSVNCKYIKKNASNKEIYTGFRSESERFLHSSNFNEFYNNVKKTIQSREDAFTAKGSGWIFNQMFFEDLEDNMKKAKDHNHLTGKYRGAAHSICNLNYKVPRFIPLFFHNLSGYDTHLFIKELDPITKNPVIDQKGKPIFKTVEIRFLDSFKFLSSSLKN